MRIIILCLSLFFLAGCNEELPVSHNDAKAKALAELEIQLAKWKTLISTPYKYRVRRNCPICISGDNIGFSLITINDFSDLSPTWGPSDSWVNWNDANTFKGFTIENFFDYLGSKIEEEQTQLEITYDPQYGYPSKVQIDLDKNISDNEYTIIIDKFSMYEEYLADWQKSYAEWQGKSLNHYSIEVTFSEYESFHTLPLLLGSMKYLIEVTDNQYQYTLLDAQLTEDSKVNQWTYPNGLIQLVVYTIDDAFTWYNSIPERWSNFTEFSEEGFVSTALHSYPFDRTLQVQFQHLIALD